MGSHREAGPFVPSPTSGLPGEGQPGSGSLLLMLWGWLAGEFPIRLKFLIPKALSPQPGPTAQLLLGSVNPLVPRAVNGMLIVLMGFLSTDPNELLPNKLGSFFSVCLSTSWSLGSSPASPCGAGELELRRQRE